MAEKILLVDDEPNVLDGYRRTLGREFALETAVGGRKRSRCWQRKVRMRWWCRICGCQEWMAFSY